MQQEESTPQDVLADLHATQLRVNGDAAKDHWQNWIEGEARALKTHCGPDEARDRVRDALSRAGFSDAFSPAQAARVIRADRFWFAAGFIGGTAVIMALLYLAGFRGGL